MDFSCMNHGTKSSNFLHIQSINSKTNWMRGGVTYQGAIPPKESENGCPNLEIKIREPSKHGIFFERYLVGFQR
jgi:hypothetical protein